MKRIKKVNGIQSKTTKKILIDETIEESFPASDPPAWTLGHDQSPKTSKSED